MAENGMKIKKNQKKIEKSCKKDLQNSERAYILSLVSPAWRFNNEAKQERDARVAELADAYG